MTAHRRPPKPKHYYSVSKGYCRYCGEAIIKDGKVNKRANWHKACLSEYKLIYWPRETRRAVWKRDQGVCAKCGHKCTKKDWDLDHRIPLIEARGEIIYWMLDNCQTLCKICHKEKTSKEATNRAERRRRDNT